MFTAALLAIAKNGNGLNRSADKWIKKMCTHISWNNTQSFKRIK